MNTFDDDGYCFVCGSKNPIGMNVEFTFNGDVISAECTPKKEYQGYRNIVHGGIIATLLDEIMVKLTGALGKRAVTAQMDIRLKRAVPVGEKILLTAKIVKGTRKVISAYARAVTEEGVVMAEAKGKLIIVKAGDRGNKV